MGEGTFGVFFFLPLQGWYYFGAFYVHLGFRFFLRGYGRGLFGLCLVTVFGKGLLLVRGLVVRGG